MYEHSCKHSYYYYIIINDSFYSEIFLKNKYIDTINKRSSHKTSATRSGGIAIFSTLFLISVYNYLIGNTVFDYSIMVPISLLVVVGLYDDIYNVDFKLKFIFQIIAAKMIIDNGLIVDNFHGILGIFEINRIIADSNNYCSCCNY